MQVLSPIKSKRVISMEECNGTSGNSRGGQANLPIDADPNRPTATRAASEGSECQRERTGGTNCAGNDPRAIRPRPRTHGKTLAYLIAELRDQLNNCQLDRERLEQREQSIKERLSNLEQALVEWQDAVRMISSESVPADPPTPTE